MRGGKRPGAGRKPGSSGRREHIIQICLSTSEITQIKRAASNANTSVSKYMRDAAVEQATETEFKQ